MDFSHRMAGGLLALGSSAWYATGKLRRRLASFPLYPHDLLDWIFAFLGDIRCTLDIREQLPKYGIPDVVHSDLASKKRSDTLFVFGSGPTINDLSPQDFEFIRKHDSLGFNYFLVHDFVPDFYCYETDADLDWYRSFGDLLNAKSQYEQVPLIIQFQHFDATGFDIKEVHPERRPTYFIVPYRYKTTSPTRMKLLLSLRRKFSAIRPFSLSSVIHHGGSISYIVSMAYALGYKKIVLLGVDMFSSEYFFTEKPDSQQKQRLCELLERTYAGKPIPLHADPKMTAQFGELPPDIFLRLFNETFLAPDGITLFVGSPKSRLASFLPVFTFPTAV